MFGVRFQITVGDSLLIAVASGTALFLPGPPCYPPDWILSGLLICLAALPPPPLIHINRNIESKLVRSLQSTVLRPEN